MSVNQLLWNTLDLDGETGPLYVEVDEGALRVVLEHCMRVCVEVNEGEATGDHLALADTHLLNQHQQGETGRSAEIMACAVPAHTHIHTH